ncbi:MAG: serine/threonine-protein kinase [Anaerolineae bacterium]
MEKGKIFSLVGRETFMADPLLNSTFGRFQIQERLGAGGVAVVYKALDTQTNEIIALKILNSTWDEDSDMAKRFTREAEISSKLKHAHIVAIRELGTHDGRAYSVMEYMKGGSLGQRFHDPTRISFQATTKILRQIASALDYAHSQGIVHRDIKLENILLGERGAALSDFGIARMTRAAKVTVTGSIVGTPLYIAPEQARGKTNVDFRADLYAFGVLGFLLVVGCFPFNGDDVLAILGQHINAAAPIPSKLNPELSPSVDVVLLKALSKQPESRFRSATEFVEALVTAMAQTTLRQTLVNVHITLEYSATPEVVPASDLATVKEVGEPFTADQLVEMAKAEADDVEKIKFLRRALDVAPMHSEANRLLFKLEGAKPRQAAVVSVPSPVPASTPEVKPLPQFERNPRKAKYQERAERQRAWTRIGCVSSIILSLSCTLFTLRLAGLAPALFTALKTSGGGPTPVVSIDGQPIDDVANAPLYVEPEKEVNLSGNQAQAADVLDPGYAHDYHIEMYGTNQLMAIYVQFISLTAHNVSPNVVILGPDGQNAEAYCQRDASAILIDNSGVTFVCRVYVAGIWTVRILGVEGESNGAYMVAYSPLQD